MPPAALDIRWRVTSTKPVGHSSGAHFIPTKVQLAGLRVFATARSTDVLEDLASRGIETFPLDVTSLKDIHRIRDTIHGLTGGKLDILVNNA